MLSMQFKILSIALLLSACATWSMAEGAAAPADAAKPTAAAADSEGSKMICKREKPMGSLIPTRICKTAAQWQADREQSRKMMQDMQQRTGSTSGR
jgi:hypothetical protein